MKRLITFFLAALMLCVLIVPVCAAGTMHMSISPSLSTADPGDEITFTVTISGSEECGSFGLVLEYDTSIYEMVDGTCTAEGALLKIFDPERGFAVQFAEAKVPSGMVGTFTLKVKSDAPAGSTEISGKPAVKNGSTTISAEVSAASVTIAEKSVIESTAGTESTSPEQTEESSKQTQPKPDDSEQTETKSGTSEQTESDAAVFNQAEQDAQETLPQSQTDKKETVPASAIEAPDEQEKKEGGSWLGAIIIGVIVVCMALAAAIIKGKRKIEK